MNQSAEYAAAMARSYLVTEGPIIIGRGALKSTVILERGWQPHGITIRRTLAGEADVLLMASYFHPSILRLLISRSENGDLLLDPEWIRGAYFGGKRLRVFPGKPSFSDMPRAQTAVHVEGGFLASRNGERLFWRFHKNAEGSWALDTVVEKAFRLPGNRRTAVYSALATPGYFYTVEANRALTERFWLLRCYEHLEGSRFRCVAEHRIPEFVYGVAMRPGDSTGLWLITDYRCSGWTHGVWRVELGVPGSERLMADGYWGTGIGFLSDKTLVLARYGESHPDPLGGIPGALVFVPANMVGEP
ncbi:MAG: hypothetical protein HYY51_00725 [Candidatus Magasanikbacteria bacterium]|nr:hypothetical protein [Candidatus Magasanikbacteria bacterium]